jgi:hypothetical protein
MRQITWGILLLTGLLTAQVPDASGTTSVSGSITDGFGQPISGATVSLQPDLFAAIANKAIQSFRSYTAASGDQGQFDIPGVVPGTYRLVAERRGFLTQGYGARPGSVMGSLIEVSAKLRVSNLKILLTAPGSVTGRLKSREGEPVRGLRVSAAHWSFAEGKRRLRIQGSSGTSDDSGAFRISGLAPGQYFIYAEPQPAEAMKLTTDTAPQRVNLLTYFPGTPDAGGAVPVLVSAGGETLADIRVRQDLGYAVSGTVIGLQGRSAAGAVVAVLREAAAPALPPDARTAREIRDSPPFSMMVQANTVGRYVLPNLSPGSYRIAAFGGARVELNLGANSNTVFDNTKQGAAPGDDGGMGIVRVAIRDASLKDLAIQLQPAVEVTRKIRVERTSFADILRAQWKRDGKEPPAGIAGKMLASVPRVTLVPAEGISAGGWFSSAPEDQTMKVAPGSYRVEISGMPVGVYVKSIRVGGVDATKRMLELRGGATELDIVLAQGSGQVTGTATDGKGQPAFGATVSLWPVVPDLTKLTNGAASVKAGRDGKFVFYNVTPGEYYAVAFEDVSEPGVDTYPDFLARFTGQATKVKLDPSSEASAALRLISRDTAARIISDLR